MDSVHQKNLRKIVDQAIASGRITQLEEAQVIAAMRQRETLNRDLTQQVVQLMRGIATGSIQVK